MNSYQQWLELKSQINRLQEELLQTEIALYSEHVDLFNSKPTGALHATVPGFKLTVVKKENVKVDQALAAAIDIGFRKKYELDARSYKELDEDKRKLVETALTVTPGKPSFTVEVVQ